jgi:hypothetical protein
LELLSVQRQEWIGWLLAMHILAGLEYKILLSKVSNEQEKDVSEAAESDGRGNQRDTRLPRPKHVPADRSWSFLVLGNISDLECYSSYVLALYHAEGSKLVPTARDSAAGIDEAGNYALLRMRDHGSQRRKMNHLNHLVTGGAVTTPMESLLLPQSSLLSQGWVLDLELHSKRAKQRTSPDFLGFEDWKTAYYGTAASPPLSLTLPESTRHLWLCESSSSWSTASAAEPAPDSACSLLRDVEISISGVQADRVEEVETVASFEKRPCVYVSMKPPTTAADARTTNKISGGALEVTLQVVNSKRMNQRSPCSLAHVLYV